MKYALTIIFGLFGFFGFSQTIDKPLLIHSNQDPLTLHSVGTVKPLDVLALVNAQGKTMTVKDGSGNIYYQKPVEGTNIFTVGGTLGKHTLTVVDKKGKKTFESSFMVDAVTAIVDHGKYQEMFELLNKGMIRRGRTPSIHWNGRAFRFFVPWTLDHGHTMKGLKYFLPYGAEFVDMMREAQREDGMIWSFVQYTSNADYFVTRDTLTGYTRKIGNKYFVRQPTENHPEYMYVNTIYQCWKASGDDAWMKNTLSSASRALNYTLNDPARWSKRFQLLKRVYTIDSWDFQVDDEYTPDIGLTNSMIIHPDKSKFGVFFGDNTGYIVACKELAEMYEHVGQSKEAAEFQERARKIEERLNELTWNGRFFIHYIDEDSTVKRNLGVDEKSQLAQSNAYSLNRGIAHDKSKAIIKSYIDLQANLPEGSPGEWYSIYPPFGRGFGSHGEKWQYMNGGVGGHVAGELALGAFENGYEAYGLDIMNRLFALAKKYDDKVYFSYTGSISSQKPEPKFRPVNISKIANMDTWDKGSDKSLPWMNTKKTGDDIRQLPVGEQLLNSIRFDLIDPAKNNRKAVLAVAKRNGFPTSAEVAINDTAACIYMLHTASKPTSENVSGAVSLIYKDGTKAIQYMIMDKHLAYWWFSQLKTDYSGIAWYGQSAVSKGVGVSWCAINNPHPDKVIDKIVLLSPEDEGIYAVLGITLSDQPHFVPVNPVSYGGPDNWAAATAMAAFIEGLAGIKNTVGTEAFIRPLVSPRWILTTSDTVKATIRFAASDGYVAYTYFQNKSESQLKLILTGSGDAVNYHIQLPEGITNIRNLQINEEKVEFKINQIENTHYIDFTSDLKNIKNIDITY